MALTHLLHRCPRCGGSLEEDGSDQARCDDCQASFRRGGPPARVEVRCPDREPFELAAASLLEAIRRQGEPETLEAEAVLRRVQEEAPLDFRGEVLGFVERYDAGAPGILRLEDCRLSFKGEDGHLHWDLLDLTAVGSSSSSVQFVPRGGAPVELRFSEDSPRRWEEALKARVAEVWHAAGRGRVVEFQPRIAAE